MLSALEAETQAGNSRKRFLSNASFRKREAPAFPPAPSERVHGSPYGSEFRVARAPFARERSPPPLPGMPKETAVGNSGQLYLGISVLAPRRAACSLAKCLLAVVENSSGRSYRNRAMDEKSKGAG